MHVRSLRLAAVGAVTALCLGLVTTSRAPAQVSIGVNVGPAPVCPYGYYGFAPYNCAPYGYYGPQWFTSGVFIGAGPWFHGHSGFYGPVNHDFDPRYGYHGPFPPRNDHPRPGHDFHDFHANDYHGVFGEEHHEGFHEGGHH